MKETLAFWEGYIMSQVDGNVSVQGNLKLQYKSNIYSPPPVVYLRMNEGTGTTAADSSNAGNGFDGTLGGDAAWTDSKYKNGPYAVDFDGASDYIDLGTSTTLVPNTAFSLSIWALPDDFDNIYQRMISRWTSGAGSPAYSYILMNGNGNGKIRFYVMQASLVGSGTYIETDDVVMTAGDWHHIVATYSGGDSRMRIYVNGSLVDFTIAGNPASVPASISATTGAKLALGMNLGGSGAYHRSWDGALDEFSLWNVELTADQVSYIYGAGSPPDLSVGIP
jgi:hypothetical protein